MLSEKLLAALNEQINLEFYSSYVYLAMSAYFDGERLEGFAGWMRTRSQEEWGHGMKIMSHVLDRGGKVSLQAIEAPPGGWRSPLNAVQDALAHERKVTKSINDLYALSMAAKDYPAQVMLQWFVTEQVEEENTVGLAAHKLEVIGKDRTALLMLDGQAGSLAAEGAE